MATLENTTYEYNKVLWGAIDKLGEDLREHKLVVLSEWDVRSYLFSKCLIGLAKSRVLHSPYSIFSEVPFKIGGIDKKNRIDLTMGASNDEEQVKNWSWKVAAEIKQHPPSTEQQIEDDIEKLDLYVRSGRVETACGIFLDWTRTHYVRNRFSKERLETLNVRFKAVVSTELSYHRARNLDVLIVFKVANEKSAGIA